MSAFNIGETVTWSSSSNGTTLTKTGIVELVVPANTSGTRALQKVSDCYGLPRNHESYMVRVPGKTAKSKGRLYWPRTSALKAVTV